MAGISLSIPRPIDYHQDLLIEIMDYPTGIAWKLLLNLCCVFWNACNLFVWMKNGNGFISCALRQFLISYSV